MNLRLGVTVCDGSDEARLARRASRVGGVVEIDPIRDVVGFGGVGGVGRRRRRRRRRIVVVGGGIDVEIVVGGGIDIEIVVGAVGRDGVGVGAFVEAEFRLERALDGLGIELSLRLFLRLFGG